MLLRDAPRRERARHVAVARAALQQVVRVRDHPLQAFLRRGSGRRRRTLRRRAADASRAGVMLKLGRIEAADRRRPLVLRLPRVRLRERP
eukprot:6917844-Prymnesium_polylepis.1